LVTKYQVGEGRLDTRKTNFYGLVQLEDEKRLNKSWRSYGGKRRSMVIISTKCATCSKELSVRPRQAGRKIRCLACKIKIALLGLVFVVVALVVFELACRVFDPWGISYFPETASYLDTMVMDKAIGYRNRPNLQGMYYGVPVQINSIGLRDREIQPKTDPDEFRIFVLGDSLPFGIGVKREDSFVYMLESLLNEQVKGGRRYLTINGGTISYNTQQELVQLKTLGMDLKPDMVILIFSENDIYPAMWVFNKRRKWTVRLLQRSYAASFGLLGFRQLRSYAAGIVRRSRDRESTVVEWTVAMGYRQEDERWKEIDGALTEINQICEKASIPLAVFTTVPRNSAARELVQLVARREGFPEFSLFPDAHDPRHTHPEQYRNSLVDGHPNPEGNKLDAQNIFNAFQGLGVLDGIAPQQSDTGNDAE
jgi:lysophospholipase L1-like esterase/DNA-directed RNA polymerase subunit RPC12/RpoP